MLGNFEIKFRDLSLMPCIKNTCDWSPISSILFCLPTFQMNSTSDFESESVWLSSIGYEYIFPLHGLTESSDDSEEQDIKASGDNVNVKMKDEKRRFNFGLVCDIDYFIRIKSYEGRELKAYFGDINGNLIGRKVGNTVLPFTIDPIIVSWIKFGANSPAWTNINLALSNSDEILQAYSIKPNFEVDSLYNVRCVISDLTQVDSDSFTFTAADPLGNGIDGLTAFSIIDVINGSIATGTLTDNGDGSYRIDASENLYSGEISFITSRLHGDGSYDFVQPQYNPNQYKNTQYKIL